MVALMIGSALIVIVIAFILYFTLDGDWGDDDGDW